MPLVGGGIRRIIYGLQEGLTDNFFWLKVMDMYRECLSVR